ncbi:MAG TPA: sugar ABC transporter permease [Herpetosiphon sp.]|uniref:Binding-protein-dependent transport systems inner membrane component n=1 Tax=Herpetosiphon aurantiacus (strain ATCC 23779 / DSM 785 / 114-95) TaxID=316274 RepID=A9B665_HERA2|nr:sugar ABC transporter permease [Herpetosiphon sp.]ABX06276.1 binding-protein-dependent transport systems inner membrane component [Herpetosiphon aurantiacus DSM 785]HBW48856.1 sugar ABC transporter permease [Herpetosiphon sp.]
MGSQLLTPAERRHQWRRRLTPYMFLLPALLIFGIFMLYPIIASLQLSFESQLNPNSGFSLDNYRRLFGDTVFRKALINTVFLLVFQVPLQLGLAMVLAVLLNSAVLKFRTAFRLIYFLPAITALFAVALIFRLLLNDEKGLINYVLNGLGVQPVPWLTNAWPAKFSLVMAITWRWTGYNMVIYLASLQSIPTELYEAAELDGAGAWAKFWAITVPMMRPTILLTTVLSTIGTLQIFDEPYLLTRSGPSNETLSMATLLYRTAFQNAEFNYASAIAYAMVLIIAVFSLLQFRIAQRGED